MMKWSEFHNKLLGYKQSLTIADDVAVLPV